MLDWIASNWGLDAVGNAHEYKLRRRSGAAWAVTNEFDDELTIAPDLISALEWCDETESNWEPPDPAADRDFREPYEP